ncbi:MAG TPA: hypothetical protein VIH93_08875 [Thermoanaerobaculia bacterium]|jgi:hypothetical protein
MKTTKLSRRLALLVAGAALLSLPLPASACAFYCWHVDASTSCCQTHTCDIVCSGGPSGGFAATAQETQCRAPLPFATPAGQVAPVEPAPKSAGPAQSGRLGSASAAR